MVSFTQKPFKLILPSRPHAGKVRPQYRELCALLFSNSVWDLKRPTELMSQGCETGPPAYGPYPRRLERLAINLQM